MSVYAKRMKTWPPAGYRGTTGEELSALRVLLANSLPYTRGYWNRRSDEWVLRQLQLLELTDISRWGRGANTAAYNWARALRRELDRRKLTWVPVSILRCEVCAHGTERLWEAPPETHGIRDRSDELCTAFVCARCWSDRLNDGEG